MSYITFPGSHRYNLVLVVMETLPVPVVKPSPKKSTRPSSMCSTDQRSGVSLLSGLPAEGAKQGSEYVWKPSEAQHKGKDKHGVKNIIDGR